MKPSVEAGRREEKYLGISAKMHRLVVHRMFWQLATLTFTVVVVIGIVILLTNSVALGVVLTFVGLTGLIGMSAWRGRATKSALWKILEALGAYVTGAWFWWREP